MEVAKLSNSFSTGNGGGNFERHVQAVFLLTLLIDNFSPVLGTCVAQLDFQGKRLGYDVDDLIITATGKDGPKVLCQIKHDIAITSNSPLFREVINAAWSDFQKSGFRPGTDKIVLATGIIAKDTIFAFRYLYDQANAARDEHDFLMRIQQINYTSDKTRNKFSVLTEVLTAVNGGVVPEKRVIWQFCKSFVLLVFDLDFRTSVNQILIHSLIKSQSSVDAESVWSKLSEFAGECNQSGACIRIDNFPDDIKELFRARKLDYIPAVFTLSFIPSELWVQLSLIGSWSETNEEDIKIVEQVTGQPYNVLKATLHQLSNSFEPYISCQNRTWKIRSRVEILHLCEKCFSDQTVKSVYSVAEQVLKQKNNRFDQDGRFSPLVPETGEFQNSAALRRGLVHGLCMLTNSKLDLTVCSERICERCSYELLHHLFSDCDWIRLASLSDILPLVAEIAPKQYLAELDEYIQASGTELARLFPREGEDPLFGPHFISGVTRSLEALAWDKNYLVSCVRCLGEIAKVTPLDKGRASIAIDAIKNILLPWHPQTLASTQKQKNAVQVLQTEMPQIGWNVVCALLPGATTMTFGTQKPKYILQDLPERRTISDETIGELFQYYASTALSLAISDTQKLEDLAEYIDYFDETSIDVYLTEVSACADEWSDEERFPLWNKLNDIKYRTLLSQEDTHAPETPLFKRLCSTIEILAPKNRFVSYRRLYLSNFDEFLLHEEDSAPASWEKKEEKKKEAVLDIYMNQGVTAVQNFGEKVNNLYDAGRLLGLCIPMDDMPHVFQEKHNQTLADTFLFSAVGGFSESHGMQALAVSGLQDCDAELISDVLSHLNLSNDLLDIVALLLPKQEKCFWKKIVIPPVLRADGDLNIQYAADRLLDVHRAVAAVNLCGRVYGDLPVSVEKIADMLKRVSAIESTEKLDTHAVQSLIQKLQKEQAPSIQELSEIELIYLPWLNDFSQVRPRALIVRLANDSNFFCGLIQLYYKRRHDDNPAEDTPKISSAWAQRLFQVFHPFRAIPGTDWDGVFHEDIFMAWLKSVKTWARENDRYEVAMQAVGSGLSYAPVDEDGLLREPIFRITLNASDAGEIRNGYSLGIYNQRGAHIVDPEGKPERTLAQKYKQAGENAEKRGLSRYAELLHEIGEQYDWEADRIIRREHQFEEEID